MNPKLTAETRERLELFRHTAQKISNCSYLKGILERGGLKSSTSWQKGGDVTVKHNYPDKESVAAMLLTARMFMQDNDQVSLRNMSALSDPGLSKGWGAQVADVRRKLNATLDEEAPWDFNGTRYTVRAIVEAFVYGEFAHTDRQKRALVAEWTKNAFFAQMFWSQFHAGLLELCRAVSYLARIADLELKGEEIEPPSGSTG